MGRWFPASAARLAKRAARRAAERRWFGWRPLDTHVVICGFPRAGSTLLELIVHCCVEDVWTWREEVPALLAAADAHRTTTFMCTKDPRDVGRVDDIRAWYRDRPGSPRFLLTVRDPRSVLTSTHDGYPPSRGYYCDFARWRDVWRRFLALRADPDVVVVVYEELVRDPDAVEARLADTVGWRVRTPFRDYHRVAESRRGRLDAMTRGALGGLRPLDPSRLAPWRAPAHRDRLRAAVRALPELPGAVVELGYETDDRWVHRL